MLFLELTKELFSEILLSASSLSLFSMTASIASGEAENIYVISGSELWCSSVLSRLSLSAGVKGVSTAASSFSIHSSTLVNSRFGIFVHLGV